MGKYMKLQFWSFDVIFAIVIFTVAITILAFTWYDINNQLSLTYGSGSTIMGIQAQTLIQNILSSGSPSDWNSMINLTNTSTWSTVGIGLGSGSGSSISAAKLYTLLAMSNQNYQATKQDLGVSYDFYIMIYNNYMNITIGKNPSKSNAFTVDVATETSNLNGAPVTVKAIVWTNTPLGIG
ncbi:hypothetical protein B2A_10481 [mine drainage metagenome]|uniref:Uncharacterized protein n=1 Tax=mine drainage metagenome TaxID=410659 RepID=T0ZD25_9ZZZZ